MLAAAFSVTGCDSGVPPETRVADAPVAATTGEVLVMLIPMSPWSAARKAYQPAMP